jgi:hypothetical protein
MKKVIRVTLEEDTALFLEQCCARPGDTESDFINSLLRQERFRQGYPAREEEAPLSHNPLHSEQERQMLERSGLLPFSPRRKR